MGAAPSVVVTPGDAARQLREKYEQLKAEGVGESEVNAALLALWAELSAAPAPTSAAEDAPTGEDVPAAPADGAAEGLGEQGGSAKVTVSVTGAVPNGPPTRRPTGMMKQGSPLAVRKTAIVDAIADEEEEGEEEGEGEE